ncbi:MAG: hypothetical protein V4439_04235 [Patescibacteria group bacterium]
MQSENRNCQSCKKDFVIEPNDFGFYEKVKVPPPTFCPECRYIKRLLNRNEWSLNKRTCDLCKKNIISIYRDDVIFPVYCHECWWSDKWEASTFGRDFDFSRPFFEQFKDLHDVVPHVALVGSNNENCEYSNQLQNNKDCYMVSATNGSEKCMYGNWYQEDCYFCSDCYMVEKFEYSYECMSSARCSKSSYLKDCSNCVSCYFSEDCRGCNNCFGCVNLRNKSNCWFNKQLSPEEYQNKLKSFLWNHENIEWAKKEIKKLSLSLPKKYYHGSNNVNFSGDYLENTANTKESFNCRRNKDTAYLQDAWEAEDCRDITEILSNELSYQIQGCAFIRNSISIRSSFHMSDSYYCDMCNTLSECFGCMGLRQKEYCILNKKYSKEEYFVLKEKIIEHMKKTGEWGEFFDPKIIAPFAYNESVAYDYFPLSKDEALKAGYAWYDRPERNYQITMETAQIPKTINETTDDILGQIIKCSSQNNSTVNISPNCSTAFRIVNLELSFYRATGMPIPQKCPACRREERFAIRNPRELWHRQCMNNGCKNEFETSYAPERPEIIYCEQCYQKEVY